ncbi:PmbA protein [Sphingomonas jejuensis]|uniref:PmbA protein n=1 Tax=Sphingomonas jejuensis TaxID=904715 RepID=A0ABX0XHI6_9SPHN|nr:TldD/PmbA family protein [Sphingomonas jejuensis]NJC32774.1 PmbA protein [Sphingomonas jejuensis]
MLDPAAATDRTLALVEAARRAGADAAEAIYHGDAALAVNVRLGALEDVERAEGEELGLRLFIGRRSASVSTGDPSAAGMAALVERAVAMARVATEDAFAGLAPADRLMQGPVADLDLDDGGAADPETLRAEALAAEDAARGVAGVTNSEGASASVSRVIVAHATSTGFAGAYRMTGHGRSASVLAGEGARMQRDYASHSARHRSDLEAADAIGRRAGERAVARLDPRLPPAGRMPVILDRRVSTSLIGHLLGAIAGSAIARGTSLLLDKLGQPVMAPGVSILDDPHRPRGLRSRPFDGEGLPTHASAIVDAGILTGWLLDSASARQLGLEPTGHAARGGAGAPGTSASNVHMTAGTRSVDAMIADMDRGVIVTELMGQGVNPVTGDYSRAGAGYLVERGEIVGAAAGFTIAGNVKDMLMALEPATDLIWQRGIEAPSVLIDGMTVAGG